jgi:hypothetical protein
MEGEVTSLKCQVGIEYPRVGEDSDRSGEEKFKVMVRVGGSSP